MIPILWTGIEYFRSELYFLKFSWLNIGYAMPIGNRFIGMYGVGFLIFGFVAVIIFSRRKAITTWCFGLAAVFGLILSATTFVEKPDPRLEIVGVQLEFPPAGILPEILTQALNKNTNAQIFVLSEYAIEGGVPDALKDWCRTNSKFLVVGGKDFVTNDIYYDTAFVIGTNGEVVFKQAKSVPIQFFRDGLPATNQAVWDSPWGKIGFCICYDLSYTRVTDELVRQGAQLIICPTMDVSEWGRHEHELHTRVAPVRAAEYGVPIFRLASSGISQAVTAYTSSKHGIAGITKALANEWAAERINVNAVAPGYIATENTRALRENATRNRATLDRIPEGHWGKSEDIAGGCLFLASDEADYLNGTILNIDGSWLGR